MSTLPSLTKEEAARRAALLDVARYDLEVDVTGLVDGPDFRAVSTIAFGCSEPGATTFVDCAAEVVGATLNGEPVDDSAVSTGRIELAGLAADNVLVVESVQRRTAQRDGVQRAVDPADGEVYVWTSFEPDDARRAWACFDQPDLKAPHALTVTAPAAWTVLSSSGDPEVADLGDGSRRWTFAPTPPLSTYVPALVAGPYVGLQRERDGYRLGLHCRRSLLPFLERDADELVDITAAGLAFFGERFAMPFPQRTYDQVFVPEMGGAMENYGCVTWSDAFVYRTEPTAADRELRGRILLHEMAHMWFGDIVTMRWWDDLWLNEAFAEWAAHWAGVGIGAYPDVWATFLASRKLGAYAADRAPTTHPIRQAAPDVATASAGFDHITYGKGAAVLKQLAALVGEDAFVAALRSHFAAHAWGNATLDDLVSAVEITSGRELAGWTEDWLDTPHSDEVSIGADVRGLALVVSGFDGVPPREHRLDVGAYDRGDDGLVPRPPVPVHTTEPATRLPYFATPPALLLLNDGDLDFVTLRLDEVLRADLLALGAELPTATSRAVAVATTWELLAEADIGAADFVQLMTDVLRRESAAAVVEPFLALAVRAADLWSTDAEHDALLSRVADTALELAHTGREVRGAVRALARTAVDDSQLEALARHVDGDVELEWHRLTRLAALDRLDDDAVAALQERDPDPDAWVRALTVRAAQGSAEAKDEVWDAVAVARRVPPSALREVGTAFWQRSQAELLAPYAERYLAALPEISEHGWHAAMAVAAPMFPVVGVDGSFVGRATEVVEQEGIAPVVSRIVRERGDELLRMWEARQGGRVLRGPQAFGTR